MLNLDEIRKEHVTYIDSFEEEVNQVYFSLVLPNWLGKLHGFPQTLYGYMMGLFSRIDLLSAYWKGDASSSGQTARMIDFMDNYISPDHEANSLSVQMWRHKLMHTSQPRYLFDERIGKTYKWLLHWGEHLPPDQHYRFTETGDSRILALGLIYLIDDIRRGNEKYITDLAASPLMQSNYEKVQIEISNYRFRSYP